MTTVERSVGVAAPEPPVGAHVTRGVFAFLSTQPFTWASSLAIAVLVPRYLGAAALGTYGVSWNIAQFVGDLTSFGLKNLLTRRVATEPSQASRYATAAVAIAMTGALTVSVLIVCALLVIDRDQPDDTVTAIALCLGLFTTIQTLIQAYLIGVGKNAKSAWSLAGAQVFAAALGIATLVLGGGLYPYAVAGLVGGVLSTAVILRASGLHFDRSALVPRFMRELAISGLPFLGWNVALRIRGGIDVILAGLLLDASVAGWLVAAYRIIGVIAFIPTAVTAPLLPALSRNKGRAEFRTLLGMSLSTVILLTVPVSATIFALAPLVPAVLGWPDSLQNAIPVMQLLAFQQPLVAVDMVLGTGLVALGLERPWLRVAIAGAILNPLLNLALIPLAQQVLANGALGAALVELTTELLFLAGALRLTPRGMLGWEAIRSAVQVVVAGIALVVVATLLRPYGFGIAFLGGGAAFAATAFALGVLRLQQLHAVRLALRPT